MPDLHAIVKQLEAERDRIDSAMALRVVSIAASSSTPRKRRTMSAAARKRIAAAQRARWAKWEKAKS